MAYLKRQLIIKAQDKGIGSSIAYSPSVPANNTYRLHSVSCKLDTAPTTSQNYTITLDANAGTEYDVVLYSVDPSATSATSIVWYPDGPLYLEGGDQLDIAYTNSDSRTWGVQVTWESV